jgi:DNA-binding protein Fis
VSVVETALVDEALTITNGNQVKASELLGVNRATLRKKADL